MMSRGLRLIGAGHNFTHHHWRISHAHPAHELVIVTDGCERVSVEGQSFDAKAGTVIYFPAEMPHVEESVGPKPAENLVLQFECDRDTSAWPRRSQDVRGRLRLLATWLFEGRDGRSPEETAANRSLMLAVLHEYIRLIYHQEDERVHAIQRHIEDNLARPLSVGELARKIGMSKYHFIRLYKKLTGLTPMAEVRTIRAAKARDLILEDRLPLKEIALAVGVGNVMALSRLCRRQFQISPAQFRKSAHAHNECCEP
jgi:AraC-like DNA-binding protein